MRNDAVMVLRGKQLGRWVEAVLSEQPVVKSPSVPHVGRDKSAFAGPAADKRSKAPSLSWATPGLRWRVMSAGESWHSRTTTAEAGPTRREGE